VSESAFTLKVTPFSTTNVSKGLYDFQSVSPGCITFSSPDVTVIYSIEDVPKLYSPAAITPMVAGPSGISKAIDFTFPSKYSFVLNMVGGDWLVVNSHSWSLVVIGGHWWLFVVIVGHSWLLVVIRGYSLSFMVIHGYSVHIEVFCCSARDIPNLKIINKALSLSPLSLSPIPSPTSYIQHFNSLHQTSRSSLFLMILL